MSWSFNAADAPVDDLDQELEAARDAYGEASGFAVRDGEVGEQIDAAIAAAVTLAKACDHGDDCRVAVTLVGHANSEHKPATGWANDCITVSVSQLDPKPEADEPEG